MAKNWAIVIGINNYENLEHLKYAKADAEAVQKWCEKEGRFERVFPFTEDSPDIEAEPKPIPTRPTYGTLRRFLSQQFEKPLFKTEDTLWFFFAGHGKRHQKKDYLMLLDSDPANVEMTALSLTWITKRLRRCGADNVVLFLDACRSQRSRGARGIGDDKLRGVITFYACGRQQESYEIEELQQGAFTYALLEVLQNKGTNNCTNVEGLYHYLCYRVPELAELYQKPTIQQPYLSRPIQINRRQVLKIMGCIGIGIVIGHLLPKIIYPPNGKKSPFEFEFVTVNDRGKEINREIATAQYRGEDLGNDVTLEMVEIPGDTFMMGTDDEEIERLEKKFKTEYFRTERRIPIDKKVSVSSFLMGKYPITQAQWKAIANPIKKIDIDLEVDPSYFKGDELPVTNVSWAECVEFCKRLSKRTGREYKLPSEAQWEYGCRAGTTTPFHFGETITTDLDNYNGNYVFASEPKDQNKNIGKTTPVGKFYPNAFGLYDMHGNVWEWCADDWHSNYQGAPSDGSAWISDETNHEDKNKVRRGGSFNTPPQNCRSAYRNNGNPEENDEYGFRVVCVLPS
ncbi:MAG: SUMF1/EgtB/PvdO family nonheme iron enzyme [Crocosphaera sp.]